MGRLFSADSALMRGLGIVADVMILNLLFVFSALPVVTLGAALTALNFTAMRIGTGECQSVPDDYLRSFRANFRQATLILALLAGFGLVLAAWYVVVTQLALDNFAVLLLLVLWYVLAFNFVMMALFVFPYLARYEGRTRDVLRNARLLSWKHPIAGLGALLLITLCVGVTIYFPVYAGYGLFWLVIGFAGLAVVNGRLFIHVFSRYGSAEASAQAGQ